jgi:hypothetical protein
MGNFGSSPQKTQLGQSGRAGVPAGAGKIDSLDCGAYCCSMISRTSPHDTILKF